MRNSLNMDFYRLLKTKSTYIIYLIYIGLMVMSIFALNISNVDANAVGKVSEATHMLLQGNSAIFVIVIFIAMFINAEFNSGYIKNIMGDVSKKSNYVLSKIVVFTVYTAIFIITGAVSAIISSYVVYDKVDWTGYGSTLVYIGVIYLLNVSFACIMTLITIVLRNSAASTSIGIIYTLTLANLLYMLINYIVSKIFNLDDFMIQKYVVEGNMNILSSSSEATAFLRGGVVAIIFGFFAVFVSIQIVRKRDV